MRKSKIRIGEIFIISILSICLTSSILVFIFSYGGIREIGKIDNFSDLLRGNINTNPFFKLNSNGFTADENFIFSGNINDYKDDFLDSLKNEFNNFDGINYKNDTVLAYKNGRIHIYYKGTEKGVIDSDANICENSRYIYIIKENKPNFYDLENEFLIDNPLVLSDILKGYDDYMLFSAPDEVFKILDTRTNLIGYANRDGILLEPSLNAGENFVDNCAQAVTNNLQGIYLRYINKSIETTYLSQELSNTRILPFYDNYALYYDYDHKAYGLIDENFEIIINPTFKEPHLRVVNGYIIDHQLNAFYSISKKEYVGDFYKSISVFSGFYILLNENNKYSILTLGLNPLIEDCENISYFEHTNQLIVIFNDICYSFTYFDYKYA